MITLSDILIDINSYLDLTADLPTGDDLTVRTNFAQQAVREWASSYKWRQLNQETSYFATGATHTLETNFREFIGVPHVGHTDEYPEVRVSEQFTQSSADKYCYVMGNQAAGQYLILNGLPSAGATLTYPWQRNASNMATLTDVCEVPDPDFVKLKVISYVLQSRLDQRFPTVDAAANRTLQNMIGREMIQTPGGSGSVRRYGSAAWGLGSRN